MSTVPEGAIPPELNIKDIARMAGFETSTIRRWQRDGKIPPAPIDGNYDTDYVQVVRAHWKNAQSARSKARWAKLTPGERTAVAKKQWTPERKKTQSVTMRNVRLGLTGMTAEELEEWNRNVNTACDTPEVHAAKSRGALELWARRKKKKGGAPKKVGRRQQVLELEAQGFSPIKVAQKLGWIVRRQLRDEDGKPIFDAKGKPVLEPLKDAQDRAEGRVKYYIYSEPSKKRGK